MIQYIYHVEPCELNDDFVQKEFGISTVDEYRIYVKNNLMEEAKTAAVSKAKEAIIKEIINNSQFVLDEKTVLNNSINAYNNHKSLARIYTMDVLKYASDVLGMSEKELYESCYDESEYQIKYYLVIGGIAQKAELSVSAEAFYTFCDSQGYNMDALSEETICYMTYHLLEEMVLNFVYDNAICL
jgi:FKBP-type peptidyl-prolyl cis-trans isomerase (trigger factor)